MQDPIIRYRDEPPEAVPSEPPKLLSLAAAVRSLRPQPSKRPGRAPKRRWWLAAGLLGLVVALGAANLVTEDPEPWVVSGSPKLKVTESGEFVRWHTGEVTLTLDPSLHEVGAGARESVLLGFDAWSAENPHLPRLSFDVSSAQRRPERDGVNLVSYGKIDAPGYRHALAITIAYSLPGTGEIIEADVIFNSRYRFGGEPAGTEGDSCRHSYDLQSVVAHEAGHFFGLGEDGDEAEATMYYKQGPCELHKRDLFETDVAAAGSVYAEPIAEEGPHKAGVSCSLSRGATAPAPWLLVIAAAAGAWCRRRFQTQ